MLEPSGALPKNMHAGVIPSTIDVFDPKDVLLLEANAKKSPEPMLISLNIDAKKFKASSSKNYSSAGEVASLGGTHLCHSWDGVCDFTVPYGRAIHLLFSMHSNSREDRIWTIYYTSNAVNFRGSSTVHTTGWTSWDSHYKFETHV